MDEEKLDEKQSELRAQQAYLDHYITQDILKQIEVQKQGFVNILLDITVKDIETLVGHFEAIGHLRGLRFVETIMYSRLEELKEEIKDHAN